MLGLKLIHVSKNGPRCHKLFPLKNTKPRNLWYMDYICRSGMQQLLTMKTLVSGNKSHAAPCRLTDALQVASHLNKTEHHLRLTPRCNYIYHMHVPWNMHMILLCFVFLWWTAQFRVDPCVIGGTKYLTHALKDVDFIHKNLRALRFKSS